MLIIKMLSDDIACNIREACDKIETAYALRSEHPSEAQWYKDMAAEHLGFNAKAHELVASQINSYKNSEAYKEHKDYADGMMAVWNDRHADLIKESARVRAMIDAFK